MEHSPATVQALLQNVRPDLVFVQTELDKRFDDQFVVLCDAGKLAEEQKDESKVKALRAQVEALVQTQEKLQLHTDALKQLKNTYQHAAEATDFQAKLALRGPLGTSASYKRELEKRLHAFDRAVWGVHNSGPMPGEDDDGLWVDSTQDDAPPNVKCPLTGKALLDLQEPVRDKTGYVYEKTAVLHYIKTHHGGTVKNPNAGVTAPLTAAELQPAKNVMRMARRKQLASQQGRVSDAHEDVDVIE